MSSDYNSSKAVSWLGFVGTMIIAVIALGFLIVTDAGTAIAEYVGTITHSAAFLAEKVGYDSAFLFVLDVLAQRWLDFLITLLVLKASFELVTQYWEVRSYNRKYNKGKPKDEHSVLRTDFTRVMTYLYAAALLSVVYFVFHQYPTG